MEELVRIRPVSEYARPGARRRYAVGADPSRGGRVDVRIARATSHAVPKRRVTMIELKVLYPHKSDKDNELWGLDGIEQARRYKNTNPDTDEAFACVYDARPNKANMLPLLGPQALADKVVLKHHLMDTPPTKRPKTPKAGASSPATAPGRRRSTGAQTTGAKRATAAKKSPGRRSPPKTA